MKLLELYSWIAGSMADFTKPFRENEAVYKQARAFWMRLENNSTIIFLICLVLGIAFAAYYYTSYNNQPGRHYTLWHWAGFLLVTFVVTFLVTLGVEYLLVEPKINGAWGLEARIALGNAIYASGFYLLTSIIWCNACPTNACRIFKI